MYIWFNQISFVPFIFMVMNGTFYVLNIIILSVHSHTIYRTSKQNITDVWKAKFPRIISVSGSCSLFSIFLRPCGTGCRNGCILSTRAVWLTGALHDSERCARFAGPAAVCVWKRVHLQQAESAHQGRATHTRSIDKNPADWLVPFEGGGGGGGGGQSATVGPRCRHRRCRHRHRRAIGLTHPPGPRDPAASKSARAALHIHIWKCARCAPPAVTVARRQGRDTAPWSVRHADSRMSSAQVSAERSQLTGSGVTSAEVVGFRAAVFREWSDGDSAEGSSCSLQASRHHSSAKSGDTELPRREECKITRGRGCGAGMKWHHLPYVAQIILNNYLDAWGELDVHIHFHDL